MPDHCGRRTQSWQTDGGVARRWHHVVECGYCHGTGIYSSRAACSCGHWADDCPEARAAADQSVPGLPDPPAVEATPRFQQAALFGLESTNV